MHYNDSDCHDLVCIYCGAVVMCEDFECLQPPRHGGVCEECIHFTDAFEIIDEEDYYENFKI